MYAPSLIAAVVVGLVSLPICAQSGNEVIFVGSSTSGSVDQHVFAESGTGQVVSSGGDAHTDNVSGAVWADTGRRLYVGQSLMSRVSVADWDGTSPTWSTFYSSTGACYGVAFDQGRDRLWTLTGSGSSAVGRELVCLDADWNSPNYGATIGQTVGLATGPRERWCMSFSGNLACVPLAIIGGNAFTLVDLDPASSTYLQVVISTTMPGVSGLAFTTDCEISVDEQYVYVLWTGVGAGVGLAVYDIAAQGWLDFGSGAGHQDLTIPFGTANSLAVSADRTFAVISGQGGAGWAVRADLDYINPTNSAITQYSNLVVPNCDGISLSPDNTRVAVTSTATFLSTPSKLTIFDAFGGNVLHSVVLSQMWNVYTTAWQDASPTATYSPFGQGCAGSLGVPAIAAIPGSRPALGSTFQVQAGNLTFGVAAMATGLSNTMTTAGIPLPFDLSIVGMTGCSQLVDALILDLIQGPGFTATWSWAIPSDPSIFGYSFFNQAFSLDPAANAFGFVASNAGHGVLGF